MHRTVSLASAGHCATQSSKSSMGGNVGSDSLLNTCDHCTAGHGVRAPESRCFLQILRHYHDMSILGIGPNALRQQRKERSKAIHAPLEGRHAHAHARRRPGGARGGQRQDIVSRATMGGSTLNRPLPMHVGIAQRLADMLRAAADTEAIVPIAQPGKNRPF